MALLALVEAPVIPEPAPRQKGEFDFNLCLRQKIRWHIVLAALTLCMVLGSACVKPNNSPVIASLEAEKGLVAPSSSSRIECAASDADGDILTYTWSATGGGFWGTGPVITWVAPEAPGTYKITVKVIDGRGGEAKNQLLIGVRENHPPVIESLTARPLRVKKASNSTIGCVASDPDGDELTYRWEVTGGNISGAGTTIAWTAPDIEGSYVIRAIVTDSLDGWTSQDLAVVVICDCGAK